MVDQYRRQSDMITQLLRHVRSSPHVADVKGDIFRHAIYPPSLVVIVILLELRRGAESPPPPHFEMSCNSLVLPKDPFKGFQFVPEC